MRIEDEIQQRRFKSVYQKAHINVLYTSAWLNQHIHDVLKPHKISWQQFNILRILRGLSPEPASVKLLTRRMIDKTSNASRLVEKLNAKGLVERRPCRQDRRRVDVFITDRGCELLNRTSSEMEGLIERRMASLDRDEARTLNQLLDKMRGEFPVEH